MASSRIIRHGINTSRAVNDLSEEGEILYRRLLNEVDDYGRMEADATLIRSECFGRQLERWTEERISRVLDAVHRTKTEEGTPLVHLYSVAGKRYLEISKFGQNPRSKSKHPPDPLRQREEPKPLPAQGKKSEAKEAKEAKEAPPPADREESSDVVPFTGTQEANTWFELFWTRFWRKVDKQKARVAFLELIKTEQEFGEMMGALIDQEGEMLLRDAPYRPGPVTWLRDKRFFDEPVSRQPSAVIPPKPPDRHIQKMHAVNDLMKLFEEKRRKTG